MKQTFTLLFIFISTITSAQNLAGVWKGFVTQEAGGYSNRYIYELTIEQRNKSIRGTSHAFLDSVVIATLTFYGHIDHDSIRITEDERGVKAAITPTDWFICIKSLSLSYSQQDTTEFLRGRWSGYRRQEMFDTDTARYEREKMCIPGEVYLVRTVKAPMIITASAKKRMARELAGKKNVTPMVAQVAPPVFSSVESASLKPILPAPKPLSVQPILSNLDFTSDFRNTTVKKVAELEVFHPTVIIEILDYERVDNDTVSVYHNRKNLAGMMRISKKVIRIPVNLDTDHPVNELILTAENLGEVPPNTSLLTVIDGDRRHQVMIESDLQKSCGIYLRYNPNRP